MSEPQMPPPPFHPALDSSSPSRISVSTTPVHSPVLVHPSYSPATSIHLNPLTSSHTNSQTGLRTFDNLEDAAPNQQSEPETLVSSHQDTAFTSIEGRKEKERFYEYPTGSMDAIKSPGLPHGDSEAAYSEEKEVVIGGPSSQARNVVGQSEMVDLKAQRESIVSAIYDDNTTLSGRVQDGHEIGNGAAGAGDPNYRRVSAITLDDEPFNGDKAPNTILNQGISASPTTYDSTNANPNEPVIIAAARQARLNRPTVVDHQPRRLSSYFADGSRAGSVTAKVGSKLGLGGGRAKAGKLMGEDVAEGNGNRERKASVVEVYEEKEDPAIARNKELLATLGALAKASAAPPVPTALEAEAEDTLPSLSSSYRENRKMSLLDALRSNPPDSDIGLASYPKRAATAPTQRRRKTTFVAPEPVDVRAGHLFQRQSVVNTPYPEKLNEEGGGEGRRFSFPGESREERGEREGENEKAVEGKRENGREEAVLTVVLYSHGNPIPKLGKLVLPRPQKQPARKIRAMDIEFPTKTSTDAGFDGSEIDDAHLFSLLRYQYTLLRPLPRQLLSARCLTGITLLSFSHLSQLAARHERPVTLKTFRVVDGVFAEKRMGRLGGDEGGEGKAKDKEKGEKLALEFVEGWAVGKIVCVLVTVLVASLAAILLWVFLGAGAGAQGEVLQPGEYSGIGGREGVRGAGGRVETGLVLGVLVLLVGWTGTGAWVLLSWLVM